MSLANLPPGWILIFGALLVPLFPGRARNVWVLLLPAAAFWQIWNLPVGPLLEVSALPGFAPLQWLRVDALSKVFGYIFTLNALAAFLYAFHLRDSGQHAAALVYVGSALGVVFAGDLFTLYVYWEIMAVASTFLILARRTPTAHGAAVRYVLIHILGGVTLLAGILITHQSTGSLAFEAFTQRHAGTWLILAGFLINAAAPPFSAWLSDAYPEATVTGAVVLSAYTTKTAVYTLIRGFPGWEILTVIGCVMTVYGIIYALLENDMRRILGYSIINQVGFMVAGVGIGTAMTLNGAVAHAFCHIIYKSLLWMSAGAVLYRVGKSKCTDLGGLYKTMPWTLILGAIGAIAISAVPLTSGFTSKTLIIQGAAEGHLFWVWLVLEIASAGVFLHAGIKFPYFVFFAKDRGHRPAEAPGSMIAAMGLLAFLCIFLGVYPQPLYRLLPFPADYEFHAYTAGHVVAQMQLLMFSALVFFLFLPLLKRTTTLSLDSDWFYRKGGAWFARSSAAAFDWIHRSAHRALVVGAVGWLNRVASAGPVRILAMIMRPLWRGEGCSAEEIARRSEALQERAFNGALPVGLTAMIAITLLAILYLL